MDSIFQQLGINVTIFYQFALILVIFGLLSQIYFKPFMRLFEQRHKRTIGDTQAATKLLEEANAKLKEYEEKVSKARQDARNEFEQNLASARKEEAKILMEAREEMKKITQEAAKGVQNQRDKIRKDLEGELTLIAKAVSKKLISRDVS